MISFNIRLADKVICATVLYPSTREFCKDYLTDLSADISVNLTESDIDNESARSDEERRLEGLPPFSYPRAYLETLALYRKIADALIEYGVILFHGSAVSLDGEVYLFTAKSGTGKSTHTRLWRQAFGDRCVMVNDDKPLISIHDGRVTVYGTPWNGKHGIGQNISAPLKALCILTRAEVNNVVRMDKSAVFAEIFSQTYRSVSPIGMKMTLEKIDQMLDAVPVYRLGCNMDIEAAYVAYNGMRG